MPGTPADSTSFRVATRIRDAPIVSGEVRISGAQTAPRSESDIRVNYLGPAQRSSPPRTTSRAPASRRSSISTDGGATWGQTTLPL